MQGLKIVSLFLRKICDLFMKIMCNFKHFKDLLTPILNVENTGSTAGEMTKLLFYASFSVLLILAPEHTTSSHHPNLSSKIKNENLN